MGGSGSKFSDADFKALRTFRRGDKLNKVWDQFVKDGDGIQEDDFDNLIKAAVTMYNNERGLGKPTDEQIEPLLKQADAVFNQADTDGNKTIDKEEFLRMKYFGFHLDNIRAYGSLHTAGDPNTHYQEADYPEVLTILVSGFKRGRSIENEDTDLEDLIGQRIECSGSSGMGHFWGFIEGVKVDTHQFILDGGDYEHDDKMMSLCWWADQRDLDAVGVGCTYNEKYRTWKYGRGVHETKCRKTLHVKVFYNNEHQHIASFDAAQADEAAAMAKQAYLLLENPPMKTGRPGGDDTLAAVTDKEVETNAVKEQIRKLRGVARMLEGGAEVELVTTTYGPKDKRSYGPKRRFQVTRNCHKGKMTKKWLPSHKTLEITFDRNVPPTVSNRKLDKTDRKNVFVRSEFRPERSKDWTITAKQDDDTDDHFDDFKPNFTTGDKGVGVYDWKNGTMRITWPNGWRECKMQAQYEEQSTLRKDGSEVMVDQFAGNKPEWVTTKTMTTAWPNKKWYSGKYKAAQQSNQDGGLVASPTDRMMEQQFQRVNEPMMTKTEKGGGDMEMKSDDTAET